MSAAPEIALLAAAGSFPAVRPAGAPPSGPLTLGTLARRLRMLAAAPERWWGLVRFDPARSVRIEVEDQPEYGAWLVVMPPGDAGLACDCDVATLIAGEAAEGAALRPGRCGSTASGTGCAATVRVTRSACTPARCPAGLVSQ